MKARVVQISGFLSCLFTFALCSLPFAFCFVLSLRAQGPVVSRGATPTVEKASPVVQLVAVGPGTNMQNRECAATGFFVNEDGYILTNSHVVEDARRCLSGVPAAKMMAKLPSPGAHTARAVSCDLVAEDRVHDLALLRIERPLPGDPPPFVLLDSHVVAEGAAIAVTGHPGFTWNSVTQGGKVVRTSRERLGDRSQEESEVMVIDITLSPGSSGSPVSRTGAGVVGVVVQRDARRPEYTVAVSIRYAIEMLERLHIAWHKAGE